MLEGLAEAAAEESAAVIRARQTSTPSSDEADSGAKSAGNQFRCQMVMIAGTIARCALDPDHVMTEFLKKAGVAAPYARGDLDVLFVQELHEDNFPHIHFLVMHNDKKKIAFRGNDLSADFPYAMNLKSVYNLNKWVKYLLKEQHLVRLPPATNKDMDHWRTLAAAAGSQAATINANCLEEAWPWLNEPTLKQALDKYFTTVVSTGGAVTAKALAAFTKLVPQLEKLYEIYSKGLATCKMLEERAAWLRSHPFSPLDVALEPVANYIDKYVIPGNLEKEPGTGAYPRQPVLVIAGPLKVGKTTALLSLLASAGVSSCLYSRGAASPAVLARQKTGKPYCLVLDDLRAGAPGGPLLPPPKEWTQSPGSVMTLEGKYIREGTACEVPAGVILLCNSTRAQLIGAWQTDDDYWVDRTFGVFTSNVLFVDLHNFTETEPLYGDRVRDPDWIQPWFRAWSFLPWEPEPEPDNRINLADSDDGEVTQQLNELLGRMPARVSPLRRQNAMVVHELHDDEEPDNLDTEVAFSAAQLARQRQARAISWINHSSFAPDESNDPSDSEESTSSQEF